MMRFLPPRWFSVPVALSVLLLAGCGTTGTNLLAPAAELRVNPRGEIANTGFVAVDLVVACGTLQRALSQFPDAMMRGRRVSIAVEPVRNDTRFALDMEAFNAALLGQLNYRAGSNWVFVSASSPAAAEADFFLAGRLQHLRPLQADPHTTLLYSYQLIDARNSEISIAGTSELKNHAVPPQF